MSNSDIWLMFEKYNKKYFDGKLNKVRLSWSPRMTLCAGKTAYKVRRRAGAMCNIRLSQPLLSQRPHSDTVNTLLHEMIHAYLHVTEGLNYRDSHGPQFKSHMKRINSLEGTKITIFHNFRREVDKFRIHVYKCDGPCVSKRPFFGILKRAIERPPGPTDKWWPRHKLECGGTFHKIEGPGAEILNKSRMAGLGENHSTHNSVTRFESLAKKSSKDLSKDGRMAKNNATGRVAKLNNQRNSYKDNKMHSLEDDDIVRKIRDKYANVKRTVLLSKEDSEHLNSLQGLDSSHRNIVPHESYTKGKRKGVGSNDRYIKGKSSYGNPCKVSAYVEGNVNYSYQAHTPEIKIAKYLKRFYEAKMALNPSSSSLSYNSFESFQNKHKLVETSLHSKKSKSLNETAKEEGMERTAFNYNYQSKTPDRIKLEKYINRYRDAENSSYSTGSVSNFAETLQKRTKTSVKNQDFTSQPGTSKTTTCPVCSAHILACDYDRHIGECFANDFDSDSEFFDETELQTNKNRTNTVSERQGMSKFPDEGKCIGKLPNECKNRSNENSLDELPEAKDCPNCGSKVHVAEMHIHIQYCVDSDSDTDCKIYRKPSFDKKKSKVGKSLAVSFVSCPSCMKKVKEEDINKHLDQCLSTSFTEEF